jgi:hypothetical protein
MYKKSSFLRSLIVIASVTTLVGCLTANLNPGSTKAPTRLQEANVIEASVLKSIAISSFGGKDGKTFRNELQAMLNPLFTVKTSPKKAEGVFSGRVIQSSVEKKYGCRFNLLGFELCKKDSKYYCLRKVAIFEAFIELKKAGEVIYSKKPVGKEIGNQCVKLSTTALDSELLRKARAKVVDEIRKDVSVHSSNPGTIWDSLPDWMNGNW